MAVFGQAQYIKRVEDNRLLTGTGGFTDNLARSDQGHMVLVRHLNRSSMRRMRFGHPIRQRQRHISHQHDSRGDDAGSDKCHVISPFGLRPLRRGWLG